MDSTFMMRTRGIIHLEAQVAFFARRDTPAGDTYFPSLTHGMPDAQFAGWGTQKTQLGARHE